MSEILFSGMPPPNNHNDDYVFALKVLAALGVWVLVIFGVMLLFLKAMELQ